MLYTIGQPQVQFDLQSAEEEESVEHYALFSTRRGVSNSRSPRLLYHCVVISRSDYHCVHICMSNSRELSTFNVSSHFSLVLHILCHRVVFVVYYYCVCPAVVGVLPACVWSFDGQTTSILLRMSNRLESPKCVSSHFLVT